MVTVRFPLFEPLLEGLWDALDYAAGLEDIQAQYASEFGTRKQVSLHEGRHRRILALQRMVERLQTAAVEYNDPPPEILHNGVLRDRMLPFVPSVELPVADVERMHKAVAYAAQDLLHTGDEGSEVRLATFQETEQMLVDLIVEAYARSKGQ